jgi:hypothetical protein
VESDATVRPETRPRGFRIGIVIPGITPRAMCQRLPILLLAISLLGLDPGGDLSAQESATSPSLPADQEGAMAAGSRHASGTAWQPEATPMHALHASLSGWAVMGHGGAAAAYMWAETRKGGSRFGITNWGMARGSRALVGGVLTLTAMGSLETLTVGDCGLPGLLASGSPCNSSAFRDFQHPHPPLMELSALHERRLAGPLDLELYGAVVGEPALGPPNYLHRLSAAADPAAPISGHEANAAHASGGVLTAGLRGSVWKVEGSLFNGAVADPDRFLPRVGPLNAASGRISLNPTRAWSVQASLGRIPGGAEHHHGAAGPIRVLTASTMYHRNLGGGGLWATSVVLARMNDGTLPRNSVLLESSVSRSRTHSWFARIEAADRVDSRLTIIENPDGSHEHLVDYSRLRVAQIGAGYLLSRSLRAAAVGIGARASFSFIPTRLEPIYQSRRPTSLSVYASLRPGAAAAHDHH